MNNRAFIAISGILVFALIIPVSATQYNPPWAHSYGSYYPHPPYSETKDTRPYATDAANKLSIVGYNSYDLPGSGAYIAFNNIKDDAVFFFLWTCWWSTR